MSNYGQQPPYGQNPYGQQGPQPNPYGAPQQPYGGQGQPRPPQPPYGAPQGPYGAPQAYPAQQLYGQPGQPPASAQSAQPPYGQPNPWTPQPPAARKPAIVSHSLPVVTMDSVPGQQIADVVGSVVGVVARTRELRPDLRAGNPIEGYATMLTESRQDAVTRLVEMAADAGADAVVGLRFDCSEITQSLSEVAAYGTAVRFVSTGASDEADETEESDHSDETAAHATQPEQPGGSAQQWPPSSWPSSS